MYNKSVKSKENYLEKNKTEDFGVDFEKLKFSKEVYENFSHRESKLKSLGIICKNPSSNILKHEVFRNGLTHNYIISKESKMNLINQINVSKYNQENNTNINLELFPTKNLELNSVVNEFLSPDENIKLLYLEGFGNIMNNYFAQNEPDNIPADLLIQSITFGGDFNQNELGDQFVNLDFIMNNYLKMFCSRVLKTKEQIHFTIVYKKRILIKQGRDIIYQEKGVENIFDNVHGA